MFLYDWALKNRPEIVKGRNSKDILSAHPFLIPSGVQSGIVFYTPIEVAVVCHFYASQQKLNKKFTVDDIFDFAHNIMNNLNDLPVTTDRNVDFEEMKRIATHSYERLINKQVN